MIGTYFSKSKEKELLKFLDVSKTLITVKGEGTLKDILHSDAKFETAVIKPVEYFKPDYIDCKYLFGKTEVVVNVLYLKGTRPTLLGEREFEATIAFGGLKWQTPQQYVEFANSKIDMFREYLAK